MFHKCILISIFSIGVLLSSTGIMANELEDLVKHPQFYNVKISPNGKNYAVLINNSGRKQLAFLSRGKLEPLYALVSEGGDQAGDFYWVNNDRVVVEVQKVNGSLEAPFNTGEIFAVNYDGSKPRMIFGFRGKGKSKSYYGGSVLSILEEDKRNILIQKKAFSNNSKPIASKINIYTGKEQKIKSSPIEYGSFIADSEGVPRFVYGVDKKHKTKLFYSEGRGKKWSLYSEENDSSFIPISFDNKNEHIYALKSSEGEASGLYKYNLKSKKSELVYKDSMVEPSDIFFARDRVVYGLKYDKDFPSYIYTDQFSPYTKIHGDLTKAFPYSHVTITSLTKDEKLAVVHVRSDKNPGEFYLYNIENKSLKYIASARPWINKNELLTTEPFRIKTNDGLTLNGLITLPKGKTANLPLVVMPHGGPHARDFWGYNPQVQMLASEGFAVVQINFRGSTGYGKNFEEAGYKNWGTKIQDDIALAAKFAIQQGFADKDRVCIFGASFGGYSAIQNPIRHQGIYKCAIGYVGVYDLGMLYTEGDIKDVKWGDSYLDKTIGTNKDALMAQSPVENIDKLNIPVFIIHGKKDNRAHYSHALALRKELEKNNVQYEWLVKDKEAHGFYNEDNILELNKKVIQFLNKYIGQ